MEEINIGQKRFTKIVTLDERGNGNANHEYSVFRSDDDDFSGTSYCSVQFQNGPVKEYGVNGCHNEDLISIVIHRLQSFQGGEFKCRENALAITKLEEAMHWLNHRTNERIKRGVEGTNQL